MKNLLFSILIFCLPSPSFSQTELPQTLFGRGMIDRRFNEDYFGIQCIGQTADLTPNCSIIQSVKINLKTKLVSGKGPVLRLNRENRDPTDQETKDFLKTIQGEYLYYLARTETKAQKNRDSAIALAAGAGFLWGAVEWGLGKPSSLGLAAKMVAFTGGIFILANEITKINHGDTKHWEIIDTQNWNWESNPRHVGHSQFSSFSRFFMGYQPLSKEEASQRETALLEAYFAGKITREQYHAKTEALRRLHLE